MKEFRLTLIRLQNEMKLVREAIGCLNEEIAELRGELRGIKWAIRMGVTLIGALVLTLIW